MAEEQDKSEKTEDATPRKLEQARDQGDVVYSAEVSGALSVLVVALLAAAVIGPMAAELSRQLVGYLAGAHAYTVDSGSMRRLMADLVMLIVVTCALVAGALAMGGLASRYLQDKPTFTAKRLQPSLEKIDPIKGFGRVFGKAALANFLKAVAKVVVVGAALVWALWPSNAELETVAFLDLLALLALAQERAVALLFALAIAAAVIGAVDYVFSRQSYMERQKMSRRDLKDEMRQSEGDPMVRMRLRQIRMEKARGRMMQAMAQATVVVTNPTHYAVALRYVEGETPAPVCLAKGVDDVALRIREKAEELDIPLVENPPLARALFATAELERPIPREHYEAVAKVIGFVLGLAQRRRLRAPRPNRAQ
jgi:flagellar biosynthetic protein FlhB